MQDFKYAALAQDLFSFRKLNDPAANFTSFGDSAINDRGVVAFSAAKASSSQLSGIYTSNGKKTTAVIEQSGLAPLFNDFAVPAIYAGSYSFGNEVEINTQGDVLFEAKASFSQVGGGSNSQVVDRLFLKKGDQFVKVGEIQSSNQAGIQQIATYTGVGLNDRDQVVYATDTTLRTPRQFGSTTIVFDGRAIAGGYSGPGAPTSRVYDPVITNDGSVYYAASGSAFTNGNVVTDISNIYRLAPGAQTPVALSPQRLDVSDLSANNRGDVVFSGSLASGESGLFQLNSAGIKRIGNSATNISVNDFDIVAYQPLQGSTPGGISITIPWLNNLTRSIIAPGDSLAGSTVSSIALDGINRSGQLAFVATFADGTSGVFRADPTLLKGSLAETKADLELAAIG